MTKLGFIGVGNMGEAILRSVLSSGILEAENVYFFDPNVQKTAALQKEFGILTAKSGSALASVCDYVLLAVKPNICAAVLKECSDALNDKALISIVAGWNRRDIAAVVTNCRILRVMPNTPCQVGQGMVTFDMDHTLGADELSFAKTLFESTGLVEQVPNYMMNGATGVAGSGPAYVYIFIEALADAGVKGGLPRDLAYRMAAQTVLGAATMVLKTGQHPAALKDAVCSPGGTTIDAVSALEHAGFRAAVLDAVDACILKLQSL